MVIRRKATLGAWTTLDETGRWAWLVRAHDRHFRQRRRLSSPPGTTFELPGDQIFDLSSFFCAIGEAVNGPGGYFGQNLFWFDDCCVGRFGLSPPSRLVWHHAEVSRHHLDHAALHR